MGEIAGYTGRRGTLRLFAGVLRRLGSGGRDPSGFVFSRAGRRAFEGFRGRSDVLIARLERRRMDIRSGLVFRRSSGEDAGGHFSCSGGISAVMTGIVENFGQLPGHRSPEGTPTTAVARLIGHFYAKLGGHPFRAVTLALEKLRGRFALAIVSADYPDLVVVAGVKRAIAVGDGEDGHLFATDPSALLPHARGMTLLRENEVAKIDPSEIKIYDVNGDLKTRLTRSGRGGGRQSLSSASNGYPA